MMMRMLLFFVAISPVAAYQVQTQKLMASDGQAGDDFGIPASLYGDTLVVGARGEDTKGSNAGAAYVFTRSGSTWTQQAKLMASDGQAGDIFGISASLYGDTLVVGAYEEDTKGWKAGAAYVFTRSGSTWTQQAKLMGEYREQFGISASLYGDTLVVGAYYVGVVAAGAAYVFTRSGSTWTQQAKLMASDGDTWDAFGMSASLYGDTLVVGARGDLFYNPWYNTQNYEFAGAAYVFTRSGSTWTQQAKLMASDGQAGDYFGGSASLYGDTLVVGARNEDTMGSDAGAAYVFTRSGSTWTQQAKLMASADGEAGDSFGGSVSLYGDTLVMGASGEDTKGSGAGAAYVFSTHSPPPPSPPPPSPPPSPQPPPPPPPPSPPPPSPPPPPSSPPPPGPPPLPPPLPSPPPLPPPPPPPPPPLPPYPAVAVIEDAQVVISTVKFSDVKLYEFDLEKQAVFKDALAKSAEVPLEQVEILNIRPGSVFVDSQIVFFASDPSSDFKSRSFEAELRDQGPSLLGDVFPASTVSVENIERVSVEGSNINTKDGIALAVMLVCLGALLIQSVTVIWVGYIKPKRNNEPPILGVWLLVRVLLSLFDFSSDLIFALDLWAQESDLAGAASAFLVLPVLANFLVTAVLLNREKKKGDGGEYLDLNTIKEKFDVYFPIFLIGFTNTEILEGLPWKSEVTGTRKSEIPIEVPERKMLVWSNILLEDVPQLCIEVATLQSGSASMFTIASLAFTVLELFVTIVRKIFVQMLDVGVHSNNTESH